MQLKLAKCTYFYLSSGVAAVLDLSDSMDGLSFLPRTNPISDMRVISGCSIKCFAHVSKTVAKAHQKHIMLNLYPTNPVYFVDIEVGKPSIGCAGWKNLHTEADGKSKRAPVEIVSAAGLTNLRTSQFSIQPVYSWNSLLEEMVTVTLLVILRTSLGVSQSTLDPHLYQHQYDQAESLFWFSLVWSYF